MVLMELAAEACPPLMSRMLMMLVVWEDEDPPWVP
jgi:hypothetical protein